MALGALVWGCTVYDSGLLPSNDGLVGSGATDGEGGKAGMTHAGSGGDAGTKASTTGGNSPQGGTAAIAGTFSTTEGGASGSEEGGAGSEAAAGSGGNAAGGVSGSGTAGSAGTGGTGGSASTVKCSDHPLPLKTTWVATASRSSLGNGTEGDPLYNPPAHAIDGDNAERWSSERKQAGDEWFQVDFGAVATITNISLEVFGMDVNDYPRAWAVRVSNTDQDFEAPILKSDVGATGTTNIKLDEPATGQFLLIRQTGSDDTTKWWTIGELQVTCLN